MSNNDFKKVAKDWVALQYSTVEQAEHDPHFWAYQKLDDLCDDSPSEALTVINEILSVDSSKHILSNVGAGPLEDLLARNGMAIIDEIESLSRTNTAIKKALGAVWENSIDAEVWCKVESLADSTWDV